MNTILIIASIGGALLVIWFLSLRKRTRDAIKREEQTSETAYRHLRDLFRREQNLRGNYTMEYLKANPGEDVPLPDFGGVRLIFQLAALSPSTFPKVLELITYEEEWTLKLANEAERSFKNSTPGTETADIFERNWRWQAYEYTYAKEDLRMIVGIAATGGNR